MEDLQIIDAVRNGDIESFRLLVERHQQPLLNFIHLITKRKPLTEEIGQGVFLALYNNLDKFTGGDPPPVPAWLFTVARNMAINAIRIEKRYVALEPSSEKSFDHRKGPLEILINQEERQILLRCLDLLTEPYRSTLIASLDGLSIHEIARKEMVLPGTIKSRLARARQKIITLFRSRTWEVQNG